MNVGIVCVCGVNTIFGEILVMLEDKATWKKVPPAHTQQVFRRY